MNSKKITPLEPANLDNVAWCENGYYMKQRPVFTLDPLFHQGGYYVQEASSMFLEQIKQLVDVNAPLVILDLCAAPGGKSTHLANLFPNSLIVSNEIIRNRAKILSENVTKWGNSNTIVTNTEPKFFSDLKDFFDIILIDAPCSGEGMFRKDLNARSEWSLENVEKCSIRQRTILNAIRPALKKQGIIVYSTCTFNASENDENVAFFVDNLYLSLLRLPFLPSNDIVTTNFGYQFFPNLTKGEGFYLTFLKCSSSDVIKKSKSSYSKNITPVSNLHKNILKNFFTYNNQTCLKLACFNYSDNLFLFPSIFSEQLASIQQHCRIIQFGTKIGKFIKANFQPNHDIALCPDITFIGYPSIELNYDEAVLYLRKEYFAINTKALGWVLITYNNIPLGWIKTMGNRYNNYYPNDFKIINQKLTGTFTLYNVL